MLNIIMTGVYLNALNICFSKFHERIFDNGEITNITKTNIRKQKYEMLVRLHFYIRTVYNNRTITKIATKTKQAMGAVFCTVYSYIIRTELHLKSHDFFVMHIWTVVQVDK